ncbi:cytochrome bd oxidase small subunit CydS [Paenibacillus sp. ALE3]
MVAFEHFTIMYESPIIIVVAIVFLFIYSAHFKNPQD